MRRTALVLVAFAFGSAACSTILGDFQSSDADAGSPSSGGSSSSSSGGSSGADAAAMDSGASHDAGGDVSSSGAMEASTTDAHDGGTDAAVDGSPVTGQDGGQDAGSLTVTVTATAQPAYVGQTATIMATGAASDGGAVTYGWVVTSAPTGSVATLAGTSTASPTFVPDVAGDYVLTVTAAAGTVRNQATVSLSAYAPTVFYMRGDLLDAGADASLFTSAYYASGSDGKSVHPVTCPVIKPTTSSGFFSPVPQTNQFFGPGDLNDFYEPAAGQLARFAVAVYGADPSGNPVLFVGNADASCATPPVTIPYDGGGSFQPRFNASGTRLAFLGAADLNIVTVNADGSDGRVVSNYATGVPDAGGSYDTDPGGLFFPPRPQWNGNMIAWVRETSSGLSPSSWEIVQATDVAGATPQLYMACPGGTPREFQFLADGSVIVAYRTTIGTSAQASGPENLYRLAPDASKDCTIVTQYTDLGNTGYSQATDFALSPDATQIAFLQVDGLTDDTTNENNGLAGGYPYVVPVAGGTPVRLSSDYLMYGPRWIGAGSRLVGARYDSYTDAGLVEVATSVIVRAPTPGPTPAPLVQADGYHNFVSAGANGGCGVARGTPPATGWPLGVLAAALACVLRRRRRTAPR